MVNTELTTLELLIPIHYNILNIVVNTELTSMYIEGVDNYNILNIVVNTEQRC